MPTWLLLPLAILGCVLWTGLLAAGVTGRWRTFGLASKQFGWILLGLAVPAIVVLGWLFIWS